MTALRYDQAAAAAIRDAQSAGVPLALFAPTRNGIGAPGDAGGAIGSSSGGGAEAGAGDSVAGLPGALTAPVESTSVLGAALAVTSQGVAAVVEIDARDETASFEELAMSLLSWRELVGREGRPLLLRIRAGGRPGSSGRGPALSRALRALAGWSGIAVALPADAGTCYGLVRGALTGQGDVVIIEDGELSSTTAEVTGMPIPVGRAAVVRPGSSLSLVAAGRHLPLALQAASRLATTGVEIEVLDPRSIAPFDDAAVVATLERTAKLLVLHEPDEHAGWAHALVGRVVAGNLDLLDGPPMLLGASGDVDQVAAAAAELAAY